MFKETKIAAAVALLIPGITLAEITYDPVGANPDTQKVNLEFTWEPTRTGGNVSETRQIGIENIANTTQVAKGKATSKIVQVFDFNEATVVQDKSASESTVFQRGWNNTADVELAGADGTSSVVEQTGKSHDADVDIWGANNSSTVIQDGEAQTATVVIDGAENLLLSLIHI